MEGMTLKQFAKENFFRRLEEYRIALESGTKRDIIMASLAIHAAKGDVPKSLWPLVNRTYRETKRVIPLE